MSEWIKDTVITLITSLGYTGIGLMMFLENLFPPIPSELIMPLAGFTVGQGKMEFVPAVLAGIIGTILGALPWYFAGKTLGEARLKSWADRYGKWLTITGQDVEKSRAWFYRHGNQAVLWGRLVPGVRTLISIPAGLVQMPLANFLAYSTLGTAIWVSCLTYAGYILGDNYEQVDQYLGPVSKIVVAVIVISFVLWLVQRLRSQSSS